MRSKKKVDTKIKTKKCPCPIHEGKRLPATTEYWHKGNKLYGLAGFCKEYRNSKQNQINKTKRQKLIPCRSCPNKWPDTNQYWRKDGKGGFRKDCKKCLARKRAEQKPSVKKLIAKLSK